MRSHIVFFTISWLVLLTLPIKAADRVVVIPLIKCGDGLTKCSGKCVDTMNNPSYCGDCSTVCGLDIFCNQGACRKLTGEACTAHTECLTKKCISGTCTVDVKFVFVSSIAYNGNLGGLAGADAKCQELADAAGLPGTYKAWLSDTTASPSTRFTKYTDKAYVLVNGTTVALNWAEMTGATLAGGNIRSQINIDETGTACPDNTIVWTGTMGSGEGQPLSFLCNNWTVGDNSKNGSLGNTRYFDSSWSQDDLVFPCDYLYPLYCFEQ